MHGVSRATREPGAARTRTYATHEPARLGHSNPAVWRGAGSPATERQAGSSSPSPESIAASSAAIAASSSSPSAVMRTW